MNKLKKQVHCGENTFGVRVALITGAARRIGAGIACALHEAGFNVVVHCHHSHREAAALVAILNTKRPDSAMVLVANLVCYEAIEQVITQVLGWRGRLDLLVNNASVFIRTPVPGLHDAACDRMWQTNVKVPYWLSEAAYPALKLHQGTVINLTDIHAEKPLKGYGWYCQTKAALKLQTEVLAREYAPEVRVNAVAPGAIAWPEQENGLTEQQQQAIIEQTPLRCHGDSRWVAMAVLGLVNNPFITGQTVRVDGGRSLV